MTENISSPRPAVIRGLVALTIVLTFYQCNAALAGLRVPQTLAVQVSLLPALEFVAHAFWAVGFGLLSLALVKNRPHGLRYTGWMLLGFMLFSIIRLLIFARADYDRQRLLFLLIGFFIVCALYLGIGYLRSR